MNCSTVPLPLLLLVGHGNLTNNGNDWWDGGVYGGGQETENRKPCPQGERRDVKHAETEKETVVKLSKSWYEDLAARHAAEGSGGQKMWLLQLEGFKQ